MQCRPLPTILDIEASGFGRNSYPIEIGFVRPDGSPFCTLIHPQSDWQHWDEQACRLHGIQREHLLTHGKPPSQVARLLNEQLGGQTVYSDGWANDYTWLSILFDAAELTPRFKLENLQILLDEHDTVLWHVTKDLVQQENAIERHRASSDARLLQLTLQKLHELRQTHQ